MIDEITPEERIVKLEKVFIDMIEAMGLSVDGIHTADTPHRMAKMYVNEVFKGLYFPAPKFTVFDDPNNECNEMVFLGDIDIFSTCSHHFASISGKCHIGYIPGNKIVGISKLARVADWFARRPQVQENLTTEIADYLMEQLQPQGLGIHISAVHDCIRVRGAKQSSSVMKTTALRGCFKTDKTVADEFLWNIKELG